MRFNLCAALITVPYLAICTADVNAAPPEDANPIYGPYFKSLMLRKPPENYAGYCCSAADCRVAPSRHTNGYWEVFIDDKTYGPNSNAPNDWVRVPDDVLATSDVPDPIRPAEAVACWHNSFLRCFDPPQVRM